MTEFLDNRLSEKFWSCGTHRKRGRDWRGRKQSQKGLTFPERSAIHKENYTTYFYPEEGELVEPHMFDERQNSQCAAGIHGFLTREAAINY